jgi:amino acid transporter
MFVAGVSAILSALCYSEFAVQFPYAGGAFNYCAVTLGELPAWLVVCMLVLSYILANAAIARSFSAYFAQLVGQDPGFFTFPYKGRRNCFFAGFQGVAFLAGGRPVFFVLLCVLQVCLPLLPKGST